MTHPKQYNVILTGKLIDGHNFDEAKAYVEKIFKLDAKKIESLFYGKETIIKSGVDFESAQKIKLIFEKGGIDCRIDEIEAISTTQQISKFKATENKTQDTNEKLVEYTQASSQEDAGIQGFILRLFAISIRLAWSLTIGLLFFSIGTVLFILFDVLFPESAISYKVLTNTYKWGSCHWFKRLKLETDEYSVEVEKKR